jgi:tetratricopeptide (TPR) repeat protein
VSAFVLDSRFGLERGFDVYDDRVSGAEGRAAFVVPERRAKETVAAASSWLRAGGDVPSFLFLHLYEPHAPYEPPEPFASRWKDAPYQGEVAAVDAALLPLLDAPRKRPTLVVLTSDHGEGLGAHGEETHGTFAYDSTLRVPLLLHAPGVQTPRVVNDAVRLIDVLPTVLDFLGFGSPPRVEGRSLLPLAAGGSLPEADTYFEALSASLDRGWAPLHGLLAGPLKYIDLPIPEIYDLDADPHEATNLVARRPHDLARLRARLARLRAGDEMRPRVAEDPAAVERLRALGYAAGGNAAALARPGPADDPKQLMAFEARERDILRLFQAGDLDEARALCRKSLAERPSMSLTWTQLASIERARGALAEAVEAGRRAAALRPGDPATIALLGSVLAEAGRPDEARTALAPFLAADDPDPDLLIAEGMALAQLGRAAEALAVFDRARTLDPANAFLWVNSGTVHLMTGRLRDARQAFVGALAVDPASARAHNGLGVVAAREGRADEAIEHWKRAVALDPRDYRSLFNLGATLRGRGRLAEARPHLEAYLRAVPEALEPQDVAKVRQWLGRAR